MKRLLESVGLITVVCLSFFYTEKTVNVVKEYDDINQVEKWKGARLCIHEDQLTPLSDDEIYYHDLMQMHVYDPNQAFLGEVVELIETGAQLVLRIRGESEWLLPYTKAFVKDVDILQKRLIVEPIEGML